MAADGQYMNCSGSVNFKIRYEGEETLVQSLISSDLHGEVLIGWKTLQRLGIIHNNFPHVIPKCRCR